MVFSIVLVALGIGAGWAIYGVRKRQTTTELDPLERRFPRIWRALENRLYFDEFYAATLFKLNAALAVFADILDRRIVDGLVRFVAKFGKLLGFLNQDFDEGALNAGFNTGAERLRGLGAAYSASQSGEAHGYLRILATAFVVVALAALILAQITGA
jgi:NADH-quinone oxidoreductase subunit L